MVLVAVSTVHVSVPEGALVKVNVTVLPETVAVVGEVDPPDVVAVNAAGLADDCVNGSVNVNVTVSPLTLMAFKVGANVVKAAAGVAVVDAESRAPLPLSTHTWTDDWSLPIVTYCTSPLVVLVAMPVPVGRPRMAST